MTIKGLLVGFSFALPYHVMRCAVDAGLSVHVLGNGPASGLRYSRFCDGYHPAAFDYTSCDYIVAAAEIRSLVAREGFDVVFPSDDVSTRLLAAVKDVIGVRTSAIPSLSGFDLLNDKWNFYQLCVDHNVRVPSSRLYEDVDELYYEQCWPVRAARDCQADEPVGRGGRAPHPKQARHGNSAGD